MSTPAREPVAAPDWLLNQDMALCPCGCIGTRRRGGYLAKTLEGGTRLLRQVMFSEDTAAVRGLLQALEPRVKLVGMVLLLVAAGLAHSVRTLAALYAVTLALAAASRLPVGFFVKRVWLFVPIFTGIVVLPATLSLVTPGEVVWTLWHWNGAPEGFTAQGLRAAGLVVARVAVSISLVVLVTLTTGWVRLLAGLRGLGVPRMFVLIVGMAYRYLFLLLGAVADMYQARTARSPGPPRHDRAARATVGAGVGALIGKSATLSEEVHQAMVSRGYRGEATALERPRWRPADAVAAVAVVLLAAAVLVGDHLLVPR